MPPVDAPRRPAPAPAPVRSAPVANLHTSNNPRGVAIIPPHPIRPTVNDRAVMPAPVRSAPVANLHTSNNPRGVAIIPPHPVRPTVNDRAAVAANLAHARAGTPRGVAIPGTPYGPPAHPTPTVNDRHAAALALIHEVHHGGGGLLGTIINPVASLDLSHVLSGAGHVASNLGSDIIHLPENTIQAAWELGKAPIRDALTAALHLSHGASATSALPHSQTVDLAKSIATQDPLFQLATGHPGRAGDLAYHHPLTGITDVLGAGAILGRVAGLGTRAAGVAKGLQPLARMPKEMPGGIALIDRRFSPNLLVAKAQQTLDKRGNPLGVLPEHIKIGNKDYPISGFQREMYRRANEHKVTVDSAVQRAESGVRKHPATGPGARPLAHQIKAAKRNARAVATLDMLRANSLTHPHTGDIFYSGKGVPRFGNRRTSPGPQTAEMIRLEAQGHDFVRRQLPSTMTGRGRQSPPVSVVLPKVLHDTLVAHEQPRMENLGTQGRDWLTQRFRRTVLPYSPKWIVGNFGEAGLVRAPLAGIKPWHGQLGAKLLKKQRDIGKGIEADRLESQALQGTHFSYQGREAANYSQTHPGNYPITRAGQTAAHKLGYVGNKSFAFNQRGEHGIALAALGKHASTYLRYIKRAFPTLTHEQHMEMLAEAYARPEVATAAGRFARQTLGQYSAFGPAFTHFTRSWAPFAPWYGNSAKFMGTLPFRHPVTTAVIGNTARATDKQWRAEHKQIAGLGGDLSTIPMLNKFHGEDIGRFMPPGAFQAGAGLKSPLDQALADAGPVLAPQISDAVKAYFGLNAFNQPLQFPPSPHLTAKGHKSNASTYSKTTEPRALNALSSFLSEIAGPTNVTRRALGERGQTPYTGTDFMWDPNPPVKGGRVPFDAKHILAGINRVFNPFRPIDLTPHRKAAKAKHSGGGIKYQGSGGGGGGGIAYK